MTQEEKAKAYDEALEKLRDFYRDYDTVSCLIDIKEELANLFPELKESEDERIRRQTLKVLNYYKDEEKSEGRMPIEIDECITWLEKQDNSAVKDYNNIDPHFGKPIDKVEPKFKAGDWITNGACVIQITSVDDEYYWQDNDCVGSDIESIDKEYHLWTIKDAKEGDVLSYVTDEEDLWVMIYWSLYEPYEGHVHYHALLVNDEFYDKGTCCICINDLKPATKEQRDTLFAKMKEAGYEWDAENLQLIKILAIKELSDGINIDKQKPAEWSEEDKKMFDYALDMIEWYSGKNEDKSRFVSDWLKSLKQRYTWKPSDEQLEAVKRASNGSRAIAGNDYLIMESLYNDLKKLKGE